MHEPATCPRCGWDYNGKHCLCEWLEEDEMEAWKEFQERPERLKGIPLEQLVAEWEETKYWWE